jgi:Zn finger protein HypA/HybF involved in hydrogenase expression
MHEAAFANIIIRDLDSIRDKSKEITEIIIELGDLVGIESAHLIEGLSFQSSYKFKVIKKESLIKCPCGYEGPAKIIERLHDAVIWGCPWCNDSADVMQVLEGDKISIQKIIYK